MRIRFYAESMYGSPLWQVVQKNLVTGELLIIRKDLSQEHARKWAEEMQAVVDKDSSENTVKEQ